MDEIELSGISNALPFTTEQDTGKEERSILPIGIYGWRKRFVYCFILLLVVMILANLSLTIWILVVMKFNIVSRAIFNRCHCIVYVRGYDSYLVFGVQNGLGALRITDGGISITGTAEFLETVHAMSIIADQVPILLLCVYMYTMYMYLARACRSSNVICMLQFSLVGPNNA